jgi:ubiquinol-cytochrome c reductase cytochrome b subunit
MKLESRHSDPMKVQPPLPLPRGEWTAEERRRWHLTRYEELKREGKAFFPHIVFKDAVVTLLVFLVLVGLALFVGAPLEEPANPSNTEYIPRPEWYFMFLFEMLKYFPGELEWVGVVLVPGIGIGVLFLLPFLDRGTARHPRQRVLVVNLTAVAMLAVTFLTLRSYDVTPTTMVSMISTPPSFGLASHTPPSKPKLTAGQERGLQLYQGQNCAMCHQINGAGSPAGPDLTRVGAQRDLAWLHEYIERPRDLNPNATMPAFLPPLTHQEVEWVAQYLSALR